LGRFGKVASGEERFEAANCAKTEGVSVEGRRLLGDVEGRYRRLTG